MKKFRILLTSALLVLSLGGLTSQFAQDTSKDSEKSDLKQDHALLVGLVRTINTAEVTERAAYGSFASWPTLLVHQQEYLNEWLTQFYSQDPNVHFESTPEILPGWNLRLLVPPDGTGWVVLLEDAKDKTGYAALSDERGVIRESKYLE